MFLFGIAVLVLIYLIYIKDGENIFKNLNQSNKALDRLNDKYINGEITEEEYIRMKDN